MPVHTAWENPELPIIHYTFTDPWTWDHFYAALEQGRQQRESCGFSAVSIIVDLSGSRHLPDGAMSHFGGIFRRGIDVNPAIEHIVVCEASRFMQSVATVLMRVYPLAMRRIHFVDGIEEAYTFLQQAT